jgi:hypothetical protein
MKNSRCKGVWALFAYFWCFSFTLSGCIYEDQIPPEITYNPKSSVIIPQRQTTTQKTTQSYSSLTVPAAWMPPSGLERNWTAIIIHHSATSKGNAAIFDKWHREGNHWEGVGYDFVIGNGTDSADGQVEVTFRWTQQKTGAHCGGTPGNWANTDGIGICLVGDFDKTYPTKRQLQSLVKLVQFLQRRYNIRENRIYGHGTTPGARITDCPGKLFPMAGFKSML